MKEWSQLAPYNCIHAMRLPGPVEIDRWGRAITASLEPLAIKPVSLEEASNLDAHLEVELNRSFSEGAAPLRFFVINEKTDGHWFGVSFDHWLADDYSCRNLMHRIYSMSREDESSAQGPSLESMPDFRRRSSWAAWPRLIKQTLALRSAWRTPFHDPMDLRVRAFRATVPEGTLEPGRKLAKANGGTLHDVFLAAAAQAFGVAAGYAAGAKRDAIAIVSAMDLRRFETDSRRRDGFGLHLNQFIIVERRPDEVSLAELIRRIAAQTGPLKAMPEADLFGPMLALWHLSRSPRAKATLFPRGAPMVVGLSNVNLTGSWIEQSEITEYRRIAPTGPVIPMVLMITTLRSRIFIDVTYRTAAFTEAKAQQLVNEIIQRLPKESV